MDSIIKAKLKCLVGHSDWEVIYAFQAYMMENWNKAEIKRDDQFNTLWEVAHRQGKIEGLKEFINSVEQIALE